MGLNTFYYFQFNYSFTCSINILIGPSTVLGLILKSVNGIIFYRSFLSYVKGYDIEEEIEKIINKYWFILKYDEKVYNSG